MYSGYLTEIGREIFISLITSFSSHRWFKYVLFSLDSTLRTTETIVSDGITTLRRTSGRSHRRHLGHGL